MEMIHTLGKCRCGKEHDSVSYYFHNEVLEVKTEDVKRK